MTQKYITGNVDYDPDEVFQSYANTPKGILKKRTPGGPVYDDTEDISIADIDDLSFDDTKEWSIYIFWVFFIRYTK